MNAPKYIIHIVERANEQLARDGVQALDNQLYQFIHSYLTDKGIEHDYRYFRYTNGKKIEEIVDVFNPAPPDAFIQVV